MGYADELRAYDAPQSDPGEAVRARLAQALRSERGVEAGPLEGAMGQSRQYFPMLAALSGMQQAPPRATLGAFMTDPNERAAFRVAGRQVGPPERHTPAEMAEGAAVLAPAPLRAVMSMPKVATAGLAAYNFLSGTDAAGGAEDANAVKDLQTKLRDAGYYRGEIDGKMGPGTQRAQEQFNVAEKARMDAENASRQLQAQESAAQAQRASAEAQQRETERRAAEDVTKAQQREAGNQRLTQMENELPWQRRALRDYGSAIGVSGGLLGGAAVRAGVTKVSNALSRGTAEKAEKLFEDTIKGTPGRVARVNEFWRRGGGGGGVPFTPTPGTAPGFAANPNAKPIEDLYQSNTVKNLLQDFGVAGAFGAESAGGMYLGSQARDELAKANDAAQSDPSEVNIRRLQAAKDAVAIADTLTNFGRAGAGGYLGSSIKLQRQPSFPSGSSAEAERLKLENILRRKAPQPSLAGPRPGQTSQPGIAPAFAGREAWKAHQVP